MKTINVATAFSLIGAGGALHSISAGVQHVEDWIADHWYTKPHLASGGVGTPEYAEGARATAEQKFLAARDAARDYELALEASQAADEAAGLDPRDPPHAVLTRLEEDQTVAGDLEAKTDEELAQLITDATGKRPHPNTGRTKLLAQATEAAQKSAAPAAPATAPAPEVVAGAEGSGAPAAPTDNTSDAAATVDDQGAGGQGGGAPAPTE